ncbi:MAG: hypothetical protein CL846_08625 [Crocinitomicaceae bacterium]|nr:hypothetical protein [Crocinitomicaceae bacterium]
MKNFYVTYSTLFLFILGLVFGFSSCTKHPDSPGYEYSDDMTRSQAIEAYVDYGLVADKTIDSLKTKISARTPPIGTISFKEDKTLAEVHMPFNYSPTDSGRTRAGNEYAIPTYYTNNESIVNEGKRLYGIFCSHCHAKDGKGNGPVNDVTKGVIACPDLTDTTTEIKSSGAIFHVITHGKGIMGPHASQLNKDERWKLVEYIRTDLKKLPIENPINNNHIDAQQSVDNNTVSMPNNENINTN